MYSPYPRSQAYSGDHTQVLFAIARYCGTYPDIVYHTVCTQLDAANAAMPGMAAWYFKSALVPLLPPGPVRNEMYWMVRTSDLQAPSSKFQSPSARRRRAQELSCVLCTSLLRIALNSSRVGLLFSTTNPTPRMVLVGCGVAKVYHFPAELRKSWLT
jgi:hypothetical protein